MFDHTNQYIVCTGNIIDFSKCKGSFMSTTYYQLLTARPLFDETLERYLALKYNSQPNECVDNCLSVADSEANLHAVWGYMIDALSCVTLVIHHAWITDDSNNVIDVTILTERCKCLYFPVASISLHSPVDVHPYSKKAKAVYKDIHPMLDELGHTIRAIRMKDIFS